MTSKIKIFGQNFGGFERSFLTILGVQKMAYFPILIFRCQKMSLHHFFFLMSLAIRGNAFKIFFSANEPKIELVQRKWTQKSTLLANLTPVIWPFEGQKSRFLDFFAVFLEFFRKCVGLKGLHLGVFSPLKVDK